MSQFFTLLTKTGQGLLANAIAYGQPLTIAELAIGDGGGKLPTPDAAVTRLVNEVRRGPINQTSVDDANPNWTVVEQVLPAEVGGWTIREVGLYDTDGNLIAYGNYPETYKPQLSEGSARTQTIRFVMEVTDTSAVTLRIDPSVVMASRKYVDDQLDAHAKSRNHPAADTKSSGFMRFATVAESKKGEESKAAQTPAGGKAQLDDHRDETTAHKAGKIALDQALNVFGDATTVQAALSLLGSASTKNTGDFQGALGEQFRRSWGNWNTNGGNDFRGVNDGTTRRAMVTSKDWLTLNHGGDYPETRIGGSGLRVLGDLFFNNDRNVNDMWSNDNNYLNRYDGGRLTLKNGFTLMWGGWSVSGGANSEYNRHIVYWPTNFSQCFGAVVSLGNGNFGTNARLIFGAELFQRDRCQLFISSSNPYNDQSIRFLAVGVI